MTERLTTLAAVKEWLEIPEDQETSDAQLLRLIDAASQFTLNYLNRDSLLATVYTQNFRGNGKNSQLLRNWPVLSVTSVGIGGTVIPASVRGVAGLPGSGFLISDPRNSQQSLDLYGYGFTYGAPSQVVYTAGFETSEAIVIASVEEGEPPEDVIVPFTPTNSGQWIGDVGVTIDDVVATLVTGTPTAGQYAVSEWGVYTFALADVGKDAVVTYSYCPWDLSQGVIELIGEWMKRKDRIGVLSKTLGGQETITYSQQDMNDTIKRAFIPYMNVVPV